MEDEQILVHIPSAILRQKFGLGHNLIRQVLLTVSYLCEGMSEGIWRPRRTQPDL